MAFFLSWRREKVPPGIGDGPVFSGSVSKLAGLPTTLKGRDKDSLASLGTAVVD